MNKALAGKLSLKEAEDMLEKAFTGKYVQFVYPGKKDVYGMCDRISIDTLTMENILIIIGGKLHSCEITSLKECLHVIQNKQTDGNTGPAGDAKG